MSGQIEKGKKTMNDWDPRENPLVQRAFRTGFRSGAGSYRLGWWLTALGAVVAVPFIIQASVANVSLDESLPWMFNGLLILLALIFVLGGFQRMLTSFSKERERGTFDFLHLSTLRSTGIVLGFLMAGQLPGYLAMVLIAPLLIILAYFMSFPISVLLTILFCLVFYVLVLSVLFLYLGFWAKKASEFRGAAVIYIILAMLFGKVFVEWLSTVGILPPGWGEILLGAPMITELYSYGRSGAGTLVLPTVSWFGFSVSSWIAGVLAFAPPCLILFFSLSASLRHRERPAWSLSRCVLFYSWCSIMVIGAWGSQPTPIWNRWLMFSILSWIIILRLTGKSLQPRTQTVNDLGRVDGDWGALLRGRYGPPFLRLAVLAILFILGCAWIGLEADPQSRVISRWSGVSVGLVLVLPLFATSLIGQWVFWRTPSLRVFLLWVQVFAIWIPLLAFAYGNTIPWINPELTRGYGAVSPFSQILSMSRAESGGPEFKGVSIAVYQAGYLVICLIAGRGCWVGGVSAVRACRTLLSGEQVSDSAGNAPATS